MEYGCSRECLRVLSWEGGQVGDEIGEGRDREQIDLYNDNVALGMYYGCGRDDMNSRWLGVDLRSR